MTTLLKGRSALVTGAARGIGLASAVALARAGARVTVTDVDEEALESARVDLKRRDLDLTVRKMDVTNASERAGVFGEIETLDILVNNAAILDVNRAQDVPLERWRTVLEVNLTAALAVTQAALPALRRVQDASVINVASTQALYGQPASVAYASAKGGLANLTRCMAIDLGAEGIRVNAIAPGFVDTRMARLPDGAHEHEGETFKRFYIGQSKIPLRRAGQPDDIADVVVFFACASSRYITGQILAVDGGLTATY